LTREQRGRSYEGRERWHRREKKEGKAVKRKRKERKAMEKERGRVLTRRP